MKKLTTLLITLFIFGFAFAQQEIEWQKTIGGSGVDGLQSMQRTSDGGYFLGGWSCSNISGDKTENCIGGFDYWIVKTDSFGNIQWQNTIGGSGDEYLNSVQQTNDGGYIIGGYSKSNISGDKTGNSNGGNDYWIVKTDSLGAIQWQNTIGGSGDDKLSSIKQTNDGGYIIGGYSNSNISGNKTENSIGGNDYWIVKTDSLGAIQGQNTIGGSGVDILSSIKQTNDGGYIIGGYSNSNISGNKTENNIGGADYWIVKTNSAGIIEWQNTIGGSNNDVLNSLKQTSDGGYILGGYSYSNISGDKTENSNGSNDYWIVKTDSLGAIQWQNTIGGSSNDNLTALQQTFDDGYIIGGTSSSNISGDKTENSKGSYDYWIVKTDSTGNIQWQKTIGGSGSDYLYNLQQTLDGGYIIGGYSNSNISGEKTENSKGYDDFWVVKLIDKHNTIKGNVFIDLNSNSIFDAGDIPYTGEAITESNTNITTLTNLGSYNINVFYPGTYIVNPAPLNYFNIVPATHTMNFTGLNQTDSLNDFAFQPIPGIKDLRVTLTPESGFHAGQHARYKMQYKNAGTDTITASLVFYLNSPDFTFLSASVPPTITTADSLVWNNITLAPWQRGHITIIGEVYSGLPNGNNIDANCVIYPVTGDTFPTDNYDSWNVVTTPFMIYNEKLVSSTVVAATQLAGSPYIDYIIQFQNRNNVTIINAKVLDYISADLDINTFQIVTSSHHFNLNFNAITRLLTFAYDSIMLPSQFINPLESHGFIRFRIKPKSTLLMGVIENKASVFFDSLYPDQTNTVSTTIINCNTSFVSIYFLSQPFCFGDAVNAFPLLTYPASVSWYVDSVFVSNNQYLSISNLAVGNHQIKLTATIDNCTQEDISNITINALPPKPVITQSLAVLTSSAAAGNQWFMNGSLIAGATDTTYTVLLDGWYAVQATDLNGCTNVSDSIYLMVSAVPENQNSNGVKLIPNPAHDAFEISGLKLEVNDEIIIADAPGKIVYQLKIAQPTLNFKHQTLNLVDGVYFVNVRTKTQRINLKLIKL